MSLTVTKMAQHARAYKAAPEPAKVVVPAKKSREQLPALHTGSILHSIIVFLLSNL